MKKVYSVFAAVSAFLSYDNCWAGAFMDALAEIDQRYGTPQYNKNFEKQAADTEQRWGKEDFMSKANVVFDVRGPNLVNFKIGDKSIRIKKEGKGSRIKFLALDKNDRPQNLPITIDKNGWCHVTMKDVQTGSNLDFCWYKSTVIIRNSSAKNIAIHADFVHFLGNNSFDKATIAAVSGCTFWGSNTQAKDLKIYSYSIVQLGGFLGYNNEDKKPILATTEKELDDFISACKLYTSWLGQRVYRSNIGFLNIGGLLKAEKIKTENIAFNIEGDTYVTGSLTQQGSNAQINIRNIKGYIPISLQWLAYFIPQRSEYAININNFIKTSAINIADKSHLEYQETKPSKFHNTTFNYYDCIDFISEFCQTSGNDNELIDANDLALNNVFQQEDNHKFWYQFSNYKIHFGPKVNDKLSALLNNNRNVSDALTDSYNSFFSDEEEPADDEDEE